MNDSNKFIYTIKKTEDNEPQEQGGNPGNNLISLIAEIKSQVDRIQKKLVVKQAL